MTRHRVRLMATWTAVGCAFGFIVWAAIGRIIGAADDFVLEDRYLRYAYPLLLVILAGAGGLGLLIAKLIAEDERD